MKSISVLLSALIAAGALVGCGGGDPPTVAAESESDQHAEHADEDSHGGEGVVRLTEQQLADAQIELATAGTAAGDEGRDRRTPLRIALRFELCRTKRTD